MKIVSLVPSITECLFDLGLSENEIVGRTKFCIHPKEKVHLIEKIGGTKNIDVEKIKRLQPDIIFANKEENVKEQVEELMTFSKVIVTNVETIEDNYYLLKQIGNLVGKEEVAKIFNSKIYEVFQKNKIENFKKIAYLIWKNPYMTIGRDTFIHHVLQELGFQNIFENRKRYPEVSIEDLKDAEVVMLSSEPFPFNENHISELQKLLPKQKIIVVDGEAFSWYGTRLAKCDAYFSELIKKLS